MDRCDAYGHFAVKCVELARTMDSTRNRSIMLQMALVWLRLAEYAAKTAARKECAELEQLTASELSTLAQDQKSGSTSRDARGRGRMGFAGWIKVKNPKPPAAG